MTRLTVERLFSDPPLSGSLPTQIRITADGRWVLFLANPSDDRDRLDLWGYEIGAARRTRLLDASTLAAGGDLTAAERSERERRRQFSRGIIHYVPSPDGRRVACLADGAVHLLALNGGMARVVTPPGQRQTGLQFSSTGRFLSYVRDNDLYVLDLDSERETRCTDDGGDTISNGIAEFIAQEEMHRFDGHWWSADDDWLAFTRVDSAGIPQTHRYEFGGNGLTVHAQRYPYAGGVNADVRLGLMRIATGDVRWLDWHDGPDDYLARAAFGGGRLLVQVQNRTQTHLALKSFDPGDAAAPEILLEEHHDTWLNLHDDLHCLPGSRDFVWTSEREGAAALYLHRADHPPVRLSTHGRVNRVVKVDREHAFWLGWTDAPTEQHLYRVRLDAPGKVERLTQSAGWHDTAVEPEGNWFVDRHASLREPPRIELFDCADPSTPRQLIAGDTLDQSHPYAPFLSAHSTPVLGQIAAADGQMMWYRLTRPSGFDPNRRYPAIVQVYGGPGVQRVVDDWAPLTLQLFAQAGYAIFELDNRGSGRREKSFEDPIHGRLGSVEVDDQMSGLDYLKTLPWVDAERIAVFGHSYGGYMALLCLAKGGGAFRAGISVAPVTDWRLYDTHYTERYLGNPEAEPDAYAASAVATHLDGFGGALLLMHGMADDNVLFDHSSRLMLELQKRQIPFELMLYPGAKHAMQERDVAIHRFHTILRFLERHLE